MVTGESIAERRRKVYVGELPDDFLRLAVPGPAQGSVQALPQTPQAPSFVPPNTRGRLTVAILDANLIKNYGIVRMDPYCRLRVGHAVFETQTHLSGSRNPQWNRTIHAYLPTGVESIYVQIFDERAFTADECIAWSHIILPPLIFNGDTIDEFYPLSGQQGEGKEGMIHLVLSFMPIDTTSIPEPVVAAAAAPAPVVVEISDEDTKELQEMFPSIDKEVIKVVLEEKRGDKQSTVTALLEMNSD